ncbi:MAG: hypothetical protein GF316_21175 [Candidatus Lokiarchaeota archaeon]|nr:hypothetical protein [Candidatus Lokiarchaeota archaeon]
MREYLLPFLFVALFIGYQISIYFIYNYIKQRKNKFIINNILIASGILIFFGMTGMMIRTLNLYYTEDTMVDPILRDLSNIIIAIGAIFFLTILSLKQFETLLNPVVSRLVLIIAVFFSSVLALTDETILEFTIIILSIVIGFLYIGYLTNHITQKIHGKARNRILIIFIGMISLLSAIIIRADNFSILYDDLIQTLLDFISLPIILFGLLTIFFGVYNFPFFLEFNWKKNLILLIIIDMESNEILYYYNFSEENANTINADMIDMNSPRNIIFSKGIANIEEFMSNLINYEEQIDKIIHGNNLVFLNHSDENIGDLLFCLLATQDLEGIRSFLEQIKRDFQKNYRSIISSEDLTLSEKKKIVSNFDKFIKKIIQ